MKILKKIVLVILAVIIVVVLGLLGYLFFMLPSVGAAPNIKVNATPEVVARGDYLANHVAGCLDCHSSHDWSRFGGPMQAGTEGKGGEVYDDGDGVPGIVVAKNLTPYHLKSWTDGELFHTITTGVNKDGKPLFPLMPYPHFNQLDPEDVKAIIAYLRTLKPIPYDPPQSKLKFPMNLIVRTIPMKYTPVTRPAVSDTVNYGKYLVNAASCTDCHTPVDGHHQPIEMKYLSGGQEFRVPSGGKVRTANLTPDNETGIGFWTEDLFVKKFRQYANPDSIRKMEPGVTNTVMPWVFYGGMTETDLRAIYKYLRTVPPVRNQVEKFPQ